MFYIMVQGFHWDHSPMRILVFQYMLQTTYGFPKYKNDVCKNKCKLDFMVV